jgi:hypothetical protein
MLASTSRVFYISWYGLLLLLACMTASIPRFIAFERRWVFALLGSFLASLRRLAFIAVMRVERVVYAALEVFRTMKPRTNTYEYTASEPFRAVVAVGNTVIRSVVVVAIGTFRGDSDIDGDLCICFGRGSRKQKSCNNR